MLQFSDKLKRTLPKDLDLGYCFGLLIFIFIVLYALFTIMDIIVYI